MIARNGKLLRRENAPAIDSSPKALADAWLNVLSHDAAAASFAPFVCC